MDIGTTVTITAGIREGHAGTLALISGPVYFVEHAEIGLRPYYREEISAPEDGSQDRTPQSRKPRKPSKQATKAVLRNLDKGDAWQSLLGKDTSREVFERHAIAYLGDKSELKSTTLESADWEEIYTYYMGMLDES